MIKIYKSINDELVCLDHIEDGVWVNMVSPSEDEIAKVCSSLNIETDYIKAALDEEERARLEHENGQTLIIVDIPIIDNDAYISLYATIPLAIVLLKDVIVTVCLKESTVIKDFEKKRIKSFVTQFKNRFVLQLLYKNAAQYLQYLKYIDKASDRIEKDLHKSLKNKELIQMLKLEKSLVYFSTSLKSNEIVLEKMLKLDLLNKYEDDLDLLEDVIIENKQAIEMANIYSSILTGTMDAYASVISNNLNIVMKFLASVTIIMAIPTMISSFFGMNVLLPTFFRESPLAFGIIFLMAIALCAVTTYILAKRRMF